MLLRLRDLYLIPDSLAVAVKACIRVVRVGKCRALGLIAQLD